MSSKKSTSEVIQETKTPRKKHAYFANFCVVSILLLLILVIAYVCVLDNKYNNLLQQVKSSKLQDSTESASKYNMLNSRTNELQSIIESMGLSNDKLSMVLNTKLESILTKQNLNKADRTDITIMEIRSGLQVVSWVLAYQYDINAGVVLLQELDSKAKSLNRTGIKIRDAIANDLLILKRSEKVDQIGMLAKVNAIKVLIPRLEIKQSKVYKENLEIQKNNPSGFKGYLIYLKNGLKNLVEFKRHDREVFPLLSPNNRVIINQNLDLLFGQLQWAIIYRNQPIYTELAQKSILWVTDIFASDHVVSQSVLNSLQELSKMNLDPKLPSLTSINVVESIIEKSSRYHNSKEGNSV